MEKTPKQKVTVEEPLVTETDDLSLMELPQMNVNMQPVLPPEELISGESLLGIYGEILDYLREERKEQADMIANFSDLVINGGDSTPDSKEALVNLVKIKSETSEKMTKIADLMTRVKLKERDTFPRYLAANQNNTINIDTNKRNLLQAIEDAKYKDKK